MIVAAEITDAKQLTTVALKSKAFWGYSDELMERWKDDLTVTPKMIDTCTVFKFFADENIAGFYVLNPPIENTIELEMLFVLPKFIRKGIGNQLITHAFQKAKELKAKEMTLLADPNAVPFYQQKGFYEIGKKESVIPNRFLPVMKKLFSI
ncbi:MAG: GNAT family N-acetyltransferase [Polaribacter sp.]